MKKKQPREVEIRYVVSTRVPPKVKKILQKEAKRQGMTLGAYVRRVLGEDLK